MRCAYPHCFNLVDSSKALGGFSGTLTALTFTAMIFLAGRERGQHPGVERTLVVFLGAFASMVVATYLYSGAASEELPGGRAAVEAFVASLAFSCALLQLFLGIAQLMADRDFGGVVMFARRLADWVVGMLIFGFMGSTAVSAAGLFKNESAAWDSLLGIGCVAMFVLLFGWVLGGPRAGKDRESTRRPTAIQAWAAFNIAIVIVAAALTLAWGERGSRASLPEWAYLGMMALLFVSILRYSMLLKKLEAPRRRPALSSEPGNGPSQ
jgi:hypothetical protein